MFLPLGGEGDERRKSANDYFHNFILKVCRATPDDGGLILILTGQREEWEQSCDPAAPDRVELLTFTLLLIEARKRAGLAVLQAAINACAWATLPELEIAL